MGAVTKVTGYEGRLPRLPRSSILVIGYEGRQKHNTFR